MSQTTTAPRAARAKRRGTPAPPRARRAGLGALAQTAARRPRSRAHLQGERRERGVARRAAIGVVVLVRVVRVDVDRDPASGAAASPSSGSSCRRGRSRSRRLRRLVPQAARLGGVRRHADHARMRGREAAAPYVVRIGAEALGQRGDVRRRAGRAAPPPTHISGRRARSRRSRGPTSSLRRASSSRPRSRNGPCRSRDSRSVGISRYTGRCGTSIASRCAVAATEVSPPSPACTSLLGHRREHLRLVVALVQHAAVDAARRSVLRCRSRSPAPASARPTPRRRPERVGRPGPVVVSATPSRPLTRAYPSAA